MKKHPIHQNLNTSFVSVSALVEYLKGLQFVGNIRIELSSYEAEIIFTPSHEVRAREYDHIAGRISDGDRALEQIYKRAAAPHGRIHVYEASSNQPPFEAFLDEAISANAMLMLASQADRPGRVNGSGKRSGPGTTTDWIALLEMTGELLKTIDTSLSKAGLNFRIAFRNTCDSLHGKYPFLSDSLTYRHGKVMMRERVSPKEFVAGLGEALVVVFERLRAQPRFAAVLKYTLHRLIVLNDKNRKVYNRLALTQLVERLITR